MTETTDTKKSTAPAPVYVATAGLSWSGGRCEPGEVYTGPEESVEWLVASGLLAKQKKGAK